MSIASMLCRKIGISSRLSMTMDGRRYRLEDCPYLDLSTVESVNEMIAKHPGPVYVRVGDLRYEISTDSLLAIHNGDKGLASFLEDSAKFAADVRKGCLVS